MKKHTHCSRYYKRRERIQGENTHTHTQLVHVLQVMVTELNALEVGAVGTMVAVKASFVFKQWRQCFESDLVVGHIVEFGKL